MSLAEMQASLPATLLRENGRLVLRGQLLLQHVASGRQVVFFLEQSVANTAGLPAGAYRLASVDPNPAWQATHLG